MLDTDGDAMNSVLPVSQNLKEAGGKQRGIRLNGESDIDAFISSALCKYHRLGRDLTNVFSRIGQAGITSPTKTASFVMASRHKCGLGVIDSDIEALEAMINYIVPLDGKEHGNDGAENFASRLTMRQHQVMDMVLLGHPSKRIAYELGISQRTVENHRAAIMRKAEVKSLAALIRKVLVRTVLRPDPDSSHVDGQGFGNPNWPLEAIMFDTDSDAMNAATSVSLSLKETSAVALVEAAENLNEAASIGAFVSALDQNHRLWRRLMEVADRYGWGSVDRRHSDFVLSQLGKCGLNIRDSDVEALVTINRDISRRLASRRDIKSIRDLALSAWHDSGLSDEVPLGAWLIDHIDRKSNG